MEWKSLRISILYFHERSIYFMIAGQLKIFDEKQVCIRKKLRVKGEV